MDLLTQSPSRFPDEICSSMGAKQRQRGMEIASDRAKKWRNRHQNGKKHALHMKLTVKNRNRCRRSVQAVSLLKITCRSATGLQIRRIDAAGEWAISPSLGN
ncbi:unnamed protein product [Linum trigynum]|uniref:Uncharacterized protein n=1 Tax=Linum trigynum TaxID=586398 RepID=A0AAV2CC59_9ROSI